MKTNEKSTSVDSELEPESIEKDVSTINSTSESPDGYKFEGKVMKNSAALINGEHFAMSVEGKKPQRKYLNTR